MSETPKPVSAPQPPLQPLVTRVQQEPAKSVLSAFVMGLILSVFPVGRVIAFFVGLGLTLLRPALLVLGGLKVWEEVARRRK
jgi:hypothetical protein